MSSSETPSRVSDEDLNPTRRLAGYRISGRYLHSGKRSWDLAGADVVWHDNGEVVIRTTGNVLARIPGPRPPSLKANAFVVAAQRASQIYADPRVLNLEVERILQERRAAANTPKPRADRDTGITLAFVGGALVLLTAIAFLVIRPTDRPAADYDTPAVAMMQCEDEVRALLKAPSTASFSSAASGSNPYIVTGTVDAENSFGAMLRSAYQCTVTISGDTSQTIIDYLE